MLAEIVAIIYITFVTLLMMEIFVQIKGRLCIMESVLLSMQEEHKRMEVFIKSLKRKNNIIHKNKQLKKEKVIL